MSNKLFNELEEYRQINNITNVELARKLEVPENYIYRWRKNGISGVYAKLVQGFLNN